MTRYEWKLREEDGAVCRWRADRHGARWSLSVQRPGEPGEETTWEKSDFPPRAVLEHLREMLFRKYQRRRVPWEYLQEIEALLEALGERQE